MSNKIERFTRLVIALAAVITLSSVASAQAAGRGPKPVSGQKWQVL